MSDQLTTDIKLDNEFDIVVDNDGLDAETVSGEDRIAQSVMLSVREQIRRLAGQRITGTEVQEIQQEIRSALSSDTDVDSVTRVSVEEIDKQNDEISYKAKVDGRNIYGIA